MIKMAHHATTSLGVTPQIIVRTDNVLLRCSHCGRIRLAPEEWVNVQAPAEAEVVMVVCPTCAAALSQRFRLDPPTDSAHYQDDD